MAYIEDCRVCKFLVKQTPTECVVYKYNCVEDAYMRYKCYRRCNEYKKAIISTIMAMKNNTIFIAQYSPLDGITMIREIRGIRGVDCE